jgi:trk system potassium uptake protein TrkA
MKVIIIGAGEVGYHIADSLSREGIDTVVIDRNEGTFMRSRRCWMCRPSWEAAAVPRS